MTGCYRENATLTIEAGVTLLFKSGRGIRVKGAYVACGLVYYEYCKFPSKVVSLFIIVLYLVVLTKQSRICILLMQMREHRAGLLHI